MLILWGTNITVFRSTPGEKLLLGAGFCCIRVNVREYGIDYGWLCLVAMSENKYVKKMSQWICLSGETPKTSKALFCIPVEPHVTCVSKG